MKKALDFVKKNWLPVYLGLGLFLIAIEVTANPWWARGYLFALFLGYLIKRLIK
jgi:hypothetical protein